MFGCWLSQLVTVVVICFVAALSCLTVVCLVWLLVVICFVLFAVAAGCDMLCLVWLLMLCHPLTFNDTYDWLDTPLKSALESRRLTT